MEEEVHSENDCPADILNEELGDVSGFLDVVYREMCANNGREMVDMQTQGGTDSKELLRLMAKFPETGFVQYLKAEAPVLRKNGKRSQQLREQGNKAYTAKKNEQALQLYTDSVRFAPCTLEGKGEELSLALANRSAVLFQMKQFRLALQDIELSFLAGYPQDMAYKLHERKGKCLKEMKDYYDAALSIKECIKSVASAKLDDDKKDKFRDNLSTFINELPKENENKVSDAENEASILLPKISNPNKQFPAFSDAIKLKSESGRGRFGVASRDIKLGELLCVEKPPVFFLHEETSGVNCSNCFRESIAPLPSPTCTQTVFCSRICQTEAMETYHVVESKFMDVLFQHGVKRKEWFLALRAVTLKPLSFFLENVKKYESHNTDYGVDMKSQDLYTSEDFSCLYNLVGHRDLWEWRDHAYKAFFALFFVRCLQKSEYFGEMQSKDCQLGPEELMIGSLMIHLMEVATMNSHEIGQLEAEKGQNWLLGQTKPVGCALEPTLVLLNHACDPTMLRVNIGTSTACFASRDVKKGEEITDCYSYPFDVTKHNERNPDLLKKYKFQCACLPCKEKWLTFHDLPRSFNDVPNTQMNFSPEDLPQVQGKMMNVQKLGSKINQLQQKEDFSGAMGLYGQFNAAIQQLMAPPHQFYVIARRSYGTCLWVKYGNKIKRDISK
eukprot:GFUD01128895.1.p1 GENE.GFUD01128895.1~~GFUD01128895.1.p1  ORF type:complete len:670 (+),score=162.71 GFUD01128895.1:141-2150(+)